MTPAPSFTQQFGYSPPFDFLKESEATSALQNVEQIDVSIEDRIEEITLVEDDIEVEWDPGSLQRFSSSSRALILEYKVTIWPRFLTF